MITTPQFFIDTTNTDDIKHIWDKLSRSTVEPYSLLGFTTNPNALDKIGCHTLSQFEKVIPELVQTLKDITTNGIVYVQIPNSMASNTVYGEWIKYIDQFSDGNITIGLKIPPYDRVLKFVHEYHTTRSLNYNVTGIADAATALRCMYYNISYVSIIPGRMEEVGIDEDLHLKTLQSSNKKIRRVITGSMRTVDGLKHAIKYNTIPTIGTRVWDQMTIQEYQSFNDWWKVEDKEIIVDELDTYIEDIPFTNNLNKDLSFQFFTQMDKLGHQMYTEFTDKLIKEIKG